MLYGRRSSPAANRRAYPNRTDEPAGAPPAYDLAAFAAPRLAVFVGSGDRLADPADAASTLRLLRLEPGGGGGDRLVANVTVGGGWGHGDFLWSVHAAGRVYEPAIALLEQWGGDG